LLSEKGRANVSLTRARVQTMVIASQSLFLSHEVTAEYFQQNAVQWLTQADVGQVMWRKMPHEDTYVREAEAQVAQVYGMAVALGGGR